MPAELQTMWPLAGKISFHVQLNVSIVVTKSSRQDAR